MALTTQDVQPKWISLTEASTAELAAELDRRRVAAEQAEADRKKAEADRAARRKVIAAEAPKRLAELRDRLTKAEQATERPTPGQRSWARRLLLGLAGDEADAVTRGIAAQIRAVQMDAGRLYGELVEAGADEAAGQADALECQAFAAWYHRVRLVAGLGEA